MEHEKGDVQYSAPQHRVVVQDTAPQHRVSGLDSMVKRSFTML